MDAGNTPTSVPGPGERNPCGEGLRNDQLSREDDPGSDDENHPPGSDNDNPPHPDSDDDIPSPEFDDDDADNSPPPPNPEEEDDDPAITLETLKTDLQFIGMVEDATLESQFSPAELHALRNPQETRTSLLDDKELRLAISLYISSLDRKQSQTAYDENRDSILECYSESNLLSYDQAKRRVSNLSGVISWKHHMCADSCVGFTGPFADLEACPRCSQPRYDMDEYRKSGGRKKIPRKVFTTFPLGLQLQARWKSPEMAQKMAYRRNKTREELDRERDDAYVFDDIFCGSDYLDAAEKGDIKDQDMVVMLSLDGAQLFRNKKSDCWIYIWIILDLAPDERYKIRNIVPGGIIPGPNHPKNLDSFLFPGLSHVSAIQKEGLKIWDAHRRAAVLSFIFVLLVLADAVAMADVSGSVGHHGRKGCRLLCPLMGRNKPGGSHYYPVLLKPHGPDNPSSNHDDIPIDNLPSADPKKYREDLNYVLTSQDEAEYRQRRRETGIKKPTIFDGLPRVLEPPTCFPGDIMHQPVINLTALMLDLWSDRDGCRKGDPRGIWPWAVLKGEIWKIHGEAVARAASYFPRSFDRTP